MYHSSSFSVRLCLRTFKKVFNGSISVFFITKGHSNVAHQFSILGDKVLLEYHLYVAYSEQPKLVDVFIK